MLDQIRAIMKLMIVVSTVSSPKFKVEASKLCMPGPQDSIFQLLFEPEVGPAHNWKRTYNDTNFKMYVPEARMLV